MIISGSSISMAGSHSFKSESISVSNVRYGNSNSLSSGSLFSNSFPELNGDSPYLNYSKPNAGAVSKFRYDNEDTGSHFVRVKTLEYLIRFLYNKLWHNRGEDFSFLNELSSNSYQSTSSNVIGKREMYYEYNEDESTTFSSVGTVITSDGRQIDFDFSMELSRQFSESYFSEEDILSFDTPSLVDPLVINFDSDSVMVTDQEFYFDIDSDGEADTVSSLASGSGFLALDRNGDGIINDGSELFGTKSQNGFYDLSKFDSDGNGFIDEADEVFNRLVIFTKDKNGNDICYHLKEKDIGAICLSNVDTSFSIKSSENDTQAVIRKTGLFIKENGEVGSIQQVDFAK